MTDAPHPQDIPASHRPRRWFVPAAITLALALGSLWLLRAPSPTGLDTSAAAAVDSAPQRPVDQATLIDTPTHGELADLLAAGHRQLARNSLSRPPGGNAIETFLTAFAREPLDPEVQAGLRATLTRLGEQVARYIREGDTAEARRLHGLARDFAVRAGLTTEDAWRGFKQQVRDSLIDALAASVAAHDGRRGQRLVELAQALDPDHPDLRPWLERGTRLPRPGDVLDDHALPWVFFAPASDTQPALAVMAREVTRGEYAEFARASGRGPARCQGRFALLRLFQSRDWSAPGFAQDDTHPVVCVSPEDAEAYARWLAERSGLRLRLPTAAEWRRFAGPAAGDGDCERQGRGCEGTRPADALDAGRYGLRGLHGNVAEWLADCAGDCSERLAAGASWRDPAGREQATAPRAVAGGRGYDDVGFRLVRELGPDELPTASPPLTP
ncbi:formylglycine-generating enzyme family protein [Rehaibacterium terrae]|uniref:formylglycine-generating enzyme family protein n=1 Tax=Rehaibacterium terrae TaxID=1341696 RepID=UPI00391A0BB7